MKNTIKLFGFIALIVIIGFSMTGCDSGGGDSDPKLTGTVSIEGTAQVGETLEAITSALNGKGTISYQWKRGTTIVGTNSETYQVQTVDIGSTITVTVTRAGYTGSKTSEPTATVIAAPSGNITYTAVQTGGEDNVSDSTGIVFTFSASVDSLNLTADDITVGGAAAKGAAGLTGSGTTQTLSITVSAAGNATVRITKTGIEADTKNVTVYKTGQTTPTLTGITANYTGGSVEAGSDINLLKSNLTVKAQYSDSTEITLSDNEYELSGTLTVGLKTITVIYEGEETTFNVTVTGGSGSDITYTAVQTGGEDNVSDSTGIVLTFSASVDSLNLTADDITVGGAAAKGAAGLTGTGTTRTLSITVSEAGNATVSISKTGIEADTKNVTVYKAGQTTPTLTGDVSISGIAKVGETLTADTSALDGSGTISYQWKRGTTDIGTNSSTYQLVAADVGSTITVTVTRSGYSGSKTSEPTAIVTLPALTGTVSISGNAIAGETLTADTTALGGSGTISYQWKRGTTDIGTNSSTYQPTSTDEGSSITVTVTRADNSGSVTSVAVTVKKAQSFNITFAEITDSAPEIEGPTISRSAAGSASITVDNPGQYDSIDWFVPVHGNTFTGSGSSFSLSFAAAYPAGKYRLTVEVKKNGVPYNKTVILEITN